MLRLALALSSMAALAACSATGTKSIEDVPDADPLADAPMNPGTGDGALDQQAIPPHVFAVHGAHLKPFTIGDVRLCPSADAARARPIDNRIPRANYPGVALGGFAEIENPGMWTSPFALDAYGLGMAEQKKALHCAELDADFYVKVRFSPVTLAAPGIVAILDGPAGAEGGAPPVVQPIAVATATQVPAFQIVSLSRDLISPRLIVRRGPLDGKCSAGELYDGQGTLAAALNAPLPFSPPTQGFDGDGIQVCVAPMNGMPEVVIARSWAELQAASKPEMVPGDFYAQKALFVIVLMGEKAAVDLASQLHAVMIPFNVAK